MKRFLRWLLGVLIRIVLTLVWAILRIAEIFFSQVAKWLKDYIQRIR